MAGGNGIRHHIADGVHVVRAGRPILDEVHSVASEGRITALLGPNGAGKSTLIRVLAGVDRPDAGSIEFDGADWFALPRKERARTAALVEQDVSTELPLTVRMAVALGRTPHLSMLASPSAHDDAIVEKAMTDAAIIAFADRRIDTLSGGERQRAHLARALAQEPRMLLLDEPTNHLDVRAQLATLELVRRLARDAGLAIVVAMHDLNLAVSFADDVIVLDRGRVVASGDPVRVLTVELIAEVWRVAATVVSHPITGAPLFAFDAPSPALVGEDSR